MYLGAGSSPAICRFERGLKETSTLLLFIFDLHVSSEKAMKKQNESKMNKNLLKNKAFLHTPIDWKFIIGLILINVFGLIMIYSASYYYAYNHFKQDAAHFFKSQLLWVVLGLIVTILVSYIRPAFWKKWVWVAIALSFVAVLLVRVPGLGHASHGAYRWIKIFGLTLQVAEPIKIGVIVGLAGLFEKYRIRSERQVWLILLGTAILSFMLYFITDNMSTAIIVFCMVYFSCMIVLPKRKKLTVLLIIGIVLAILLVVVLVSRDYELGENFRITRIRAWLDPTNPLFITEEAYQPTQASYAIASGGFFGKGLGQSLIKFKLPEPHNDYILSIIFEELGIFGALILISLFAYLLYKTFRVFLEAKDRFDKMLVLGVFLHLSLQTILNFGVTLGLLPTTGVTLPFISAGGTSAFFLLIEFGLVMSVERQNEERRLYNETKTEMENNDPYLKHLWEEEKEREQHEQN